MKILSEHLDNFGIPMLEGQKLKEERRKSFLSTLVEDRGEKSVYTLLLFNGCDLPEILHCSHFATDDVSKLDDIINACDEYFEQQSESRELVFNEPGVLGKEDQTILKLTSGDPYMDLYDKLCEVAKYKYPKFIPHISVTSNVKEFTGTSSALVISSDGKEVKRYTLMLPPAKET